MALMDADFSFSYNSYPTPVQTTFYFCRPTWFYEICHMQISKYPTNFTDVNVYQQHDGCRLTYLLQQNDVKMTHGYDSLTKS